jgi:orotate phosphoribosyltransferase-like protein
MVRATSDDTPNRTVNKQGILEWDSNTVRRAVELREQGHTYRQIDMKLSLPEGTAWRLINRQAYRERVNESTAKYYKRGYKALWEDEDE